MGGLWGIAGLALLSLGDPAAPAPGDPGLDAFGYEASETDAVGGENAPGLLQRLRIPEELDARDNKPSDAQLQSDGQLDVLEGQINALRGQIQETRSMVYQLGETLAPSFVTGTKLLVIHRNTLGSAFALDSLEVKIDGYTVYANHDPKRLGAENEAVVFDASVLPGNHTLDAVYTLRATGYGVLTYMRSYTFDLRSQYFFTAPKGEALELDIETFDQGSGKDLRERPALRFAVR